MKQKVDFKNKHVILPPFFSGESRTKVTVEVKLHSPSALMCEMYEMEADFIEEWMVLLMEEILHQVVDSLSVYHIIYDGFYTSQVVQDFFHQQ